MAKEPRSTTAPGVDGELMPQRQVLEDEISAGADRCEECCDKQTEAEHKRASRGSPILCYLRTELHLSGFAVPRPELTANALRDWCRFSGTGSSYIEPGAPWENPYVESFNGRLRDEFLAVEQFDSLLEAQVLLEDWRIEYNTKRPHSSLGWLAPAAYAER